MQKTTWIVFGVVVLGAIGYIIFSIREESKFPSPRLKHMFTDGDLKIELIYGSPSKRGRGIFGELVPYNRLWRTGDNEATELNTNKDLDFGGQLLTAGSYSVWAEPKEEEWRVIFNSRIPPWGINSFGYADCMHEYDVVIVFSPVQLVESVTEMFTMTIQKADSSYNLVFDWDKTKVEIPFAQK